MTSHNLLLYGPSMKLGEKIAAALVALKMTAEQLANASGVTYESVRKWMRGKTAPNRNRMVKVAEALHLTPAQLLDPNAKIDFVALSKGLKQQFDVTPVYIWRETANTPHESSLRAKSVEAGLVTKEHGPTWRFSEAHAMRFPSENLAGIDLDPELVGAVSAEDSYMKSSGILKGDAVLLDLRQAAVLDGQVYAIVTGGKLILRKLYEKPGGGLMIVSDSPAESPTIELSLVEREHIAIVGRYLFRMGGAPKPPS